MDRITLRGLRARGRHGVLPEERALGQTFVVDVELGVDTRRAAATDALSETVHYGVVAEEVVAVVSGEPCQLLETLAQRVADRCLAHAAVREATVTVHKPQAPIPVPFDDVSVTITRTRAAPGDPPAASTEPREASRDRPAAPAASAGPAEAGRPGRSTGSGAPSPGSDLPTSAVPSSVPPSADSLAAGSPSSDPFPSDPLPPRTRTSQRSRA